MKYIQPEAFLKTFTCPHCGTLAKQDWNSRDLHFGLRGTFDLEELRIGHCHSCGDYTIWLKEMMLFPNTGSNPIPNPEMPESAKVLYQEASSIVSKSPRGAAALLRLAIQVLCKELGEDGKNINKDISNLVKKGLPQIIQQSLDIVRVTGNDAVHPGQIDTDDELTVLKLFDLLNVIVEYMIALPNKVNGLYSSLPADKLEGIKRRDSK